MLPKGYVGCWVVVFVVVLAIVLMLAVVFRLRYVTVQEQQDLWRSTGVNEYTLMMRSGSSEYPMTVEALFDMAYHCVVTCDVAFHAEYGFPTFISGFLLLEDIDGPLLSDVHMEIVAFDAL